MTIEFSDDKQFIAIWFVPPPPQGSPLPLHRRRMDWFCGSWLNPDGTLEFHHRFHYYDQPNDPSAGERSWSGMKSREPADYQMIEHHLTVMRQLVEMNELRNGTKAVEVLCHQCTGSEATRLLEQYSWWHKKPDGWDVASGEPANSG